MKGWRPHVTTYRLQVPISPTSPPQKYKDVEPSLSISEVDGLELVRKFSEDMEAMLHRKVEAVKVL